MTASRTRKARGAATQNLVAAYLRARGWPHAESTGAGRAGMDILGVPGAAIEVKARRDLRLIEWLRQASRSPGLPVVVHRPDGMGPASIDEWPATLRLADLVALLHAAGYGEAGMGEAL